MIIKFPTEYKPQKNEQILKLRVDRRETSVFLVEDNDKEPVIFKCWYGNDFTERKLQNAIKKIIANSPNKKVVVKGELNMNKFTFYKQKSGLSYSQLAEMTGISANVLKHFGSGYRDIKKANVVIVSKISTALNCSIEDLISEEE